MKTLPIAENPLETRADLERALIQMLCPLIPHFLEGGTGLHLGETGVRYSPRTAAMEGWSRVLWGIAPLLSGKSETAEGSGLLCGRDFRKFLDLHLEGFTRGTDLDDPASWGMPHACDQRHVEMAAIALALLLAPGRYWEPLSAEQRDNVYRWLSTIETMNLPANNWHFFRVLVCSAFKRLGLPVNENALAESFSLIDSFYKGDGWYMDGQDINFDYYNPFGFHFYGLVYAKLMGDLDPGRAQTFRARARLFAKQFLPWVREDGSVIPYGRSLAYRFGVIAFFSACAFDGLDVLSMGELKGIVLRHLRWWFSRPIFDAQGILTIGFGYPNLVMAEQYNSPSSPYWALKSFLVLALDKAHPFWTATEAPLPAQRGVSTLSVPQYVITRSPEDAVLLCPGRYPGKEMVHGAAKFSKFAYSARFGFSVPHANYSLEKTGCDSMLVLSEGDGYWRERRHAEAQRSGSCWTQGLWRPWADVEISTTLVGFGAWHVRVHRIRSARALTGVEGGFAVACFNGLELQRDPEIRILQPQDAGGAGCSIAFPWAATRIVDIPVAGAQPRQAESLTLEPNLNIISPVSILPILRGEIPVGETWFACAVRAGDRATVKDDAIPVVSIDREKGVGIADGSGGIEWIGL